MIKERILVVDDAQEISGFLCEFMLKPNGYQTEIAPDGRTALQAILRQPPDLVFLDVNLPDYSGLDLLKEIKALHPACAVIMITSDASAETILRAFRLGAHDYIQKPFTLEEVLQTLESVFAKSRWQKERDGLVSALNEANYHLRRQVNLWETLNKIGQTITATLDETDVQRRLMSGINQLLRVETGSLFLVDEATGELCLKISLREETAKLGEIRLQPGEGVVGWVVENKQPALIPEAYKDRRFFPGVDQQHTGFLTRSILAVPLISKGQVIGVIEVLNPLDRDKQFDSEDQAILETLAASVAVAVENSRLHDLMRHSVRLDTLKKTMVTLSHHINNSLMAFSMIAGLLQENITIIPVERRPDWWTHAVATIRSETTRISAVLSTLKQITTIRETAYHGDTQMLDIDNELAEVLETTAVHEP